jgi:hypothetical protein
LIAISSLLRIGRRGRGTGHRWRRGRGRLDTGANSEADDVDRRVVLPDRQRFDLAVDDLDRPEQQVRAPEIAHEIGERDEGRAAPLNRQRLRGLFHVGQPEHVRETAAHVIEQLHRDALAGAELFDQLHALLQLPAPRLELLHLGEERLQPRLLALRRLDGGLHLSRVLLERPVPPADTERRGDEDQAAGERQLLADVEGRGLACLALDAEEVDANHRSPTFRRARPTATAAVAA